MASESFEFIEELEITFNSQFSKHINYNKLDEFDELDDPAKIPTSDQKIYFPNTLNGLKWKEIKKLSLLTGKNGVGKSKILKLIVSAFNDKINEKKSFRSMIKINSNENFDFDNDKYLVSLIHFDGNLTNLKNDSYYNNSENSIRWESNFNIENSFSHLSKELIYSLPYHQIKHETFIKINSSLCNICYNVNFICIEIDRINELLNESFKIYYTSKADNLELNLQRTTESEWLLYLFKVNDASQLNPEIHKILKSFQYKNEIVLKKIDIQRVNISLINQEIEKSLLSFRISEKPKPYFLLKKNDMAHEETLYKLEDKDIGTLLYIIDRCEESLNEDQITKLSKVCRNVGLNSYAKMNAINKKYKYLEFNLNLDSNILSFTIDVDYDEQNGNADTLTLSFDDLDSLQKKKLFNIWQLSSTFTIEDLLLKKINESNIEEFNNETMIQKKMYFLSRFQKEFQQEITKFAEMENLEISIREEQQEQGLLSNSTLTKIVNWLEKINKLYDMKLELKNEDNFYYIDEIVEKLRKVLSYKKKSIESISGFQNILLDYCKILHFKIGILKYSKIEVSFFKNHVIEMFKNNILDYYKNAKDNFYEPDLLKLYKSSKETIINDKEVEESNFLKSLVNFFDEKKEEKNDFNYYFQEYVIAFNKIDYMKIENEWVFENPSNNNLKITELTTGEQIILLTILLEFEAKILNNKKLILLLDEPDCFLHPFAIKKFIERLKKLTSENNNVQVILTSHNPGTISLMDDDENVFYFDNKSSPPTVIAPCTKKTKLRILEGITDKLFFLLDPYMLVFVEGKYDWIFYSVIRQKHNVNASKQIPIIFRGMGSNQFKFFFKIENQIKEGESDLYNYIRGIIDGDTFIGHQEAIRYYLTSYHDSRHIRLEETLDYMARNKSLNSISIDNELRDLVKKVVQDYQNKNENSETKIKHNENYNQLINNFAATIRKQSSNNIIDFIVDKVRSRTADTLNLYETKYLFVLKRRYIENYIYDPLNIFFLIESLRISLLPKKDYGLRNKKKEIFDPDANTNIISFDRSKLANTEYAEFLATNGNKLIQNFSTWLKNQNLITLSCNNVPVELNISRLHEKSKLVTLNYDSALLYGEFKEIGTRLYNYIGIDDYFSNAVKRDKKEIFTNGSILKYYESKPNDEILFYNRVLPVDLEHVVFDININ